MQEYVFCNSTDTCCEVQCLLAVCLCNGTIMTCECSSGQTVAHFLCVSHWRTWHAEVSHIQGAAKCRLATGNVCAVHDCRPGGACTFDAVHVWGRSQRHEAHEFVQAVLFTANCAVVAPLPTRL